MRNAVIVGFKRSPFTMARKGEMVEVRPEDILSQTINSLIEETKINKDDIEDIVTGCAYPEGAQGNNIAKIVSFMTGMPEHVAGMTVNRWCGSSMQAIHDATGAIAINSGNVFVCCGVASSSAGTARALRPVALQERLRPEPGHALAGCDPRRPTPVYASDC